MIVEKMLTPKGWLCAPWHINVGHMSACQKNIDEIIEQSLKPLLKQEGYRKADRTWHRECQDAIQVVNIQSSMFSDSNEAKFTINVGCYYPQVAKLLGDRVLQKPKEYECMIRTRLGMLRPENTDLWWIITPDMALERIEKEIVQLWTKYGNPWINAHAKIERALNDEKYILGPRNILGMYFLARTPEESKNIMNRLLREKPKAAAIINSTAKKLNLSTVKEFSS